jgi:hypothetical protein
VKTALKLSLNGNHDLVVSYLMNQLYLMVVQCPGKRNGF